MVRSLRVAFVLVLAAMLWGTVRASLEQALFDVPPEVYRNPWFQVTLLDAYFAFLTFWLWVAWKERSAGARVLWLLAILLWGNFAMAIYALVQLFRVPADGSVDEVVTGRNPGRIALPSTLVALGAAVYALGAKNVLFGG